jgi:hypothetical protein
VSDPDPLARLFAVANDYELETLNRVRLKAGLIWECAARVGDVDRCGAWNDERLTTCEECGTPRPSAEVAPEELERRIARLVGRFPGLGGGAEPVAAEEFVRAFRDDVAPLYAPASAR